MADFTPPSEDRSRLDTREIASILWNPKFRYRVRKSFQLGQINSVCTVASHFPMLRFNTILSFTSWSSHCLLSFHFATKPVYLLMFSPMRATFPINLIHLGEANKLCHFSLRFVLQHPIFITLFSSTVKLLLLCQRASSTPLQNCNQNFNRTVSRFTLS